MGSQFTPVRTVFGIGHHSNYPPHRCYVFSCNDNIESCGTSPEVGYTAAHTPVVTETLDELYDADLISGDDVDIIGSDFSVNCTLYLGELRDGSSSTLIFPPTCPSGTSFN